MVPLVGVMCAENSLLPMASPGIQLISECNLPAEGPGYEAMHGCIVMRDVCRLLYTTDNIIIRSLHFSSETNLYFIHCYEVVTGIRC